MIVTDSTVVSAQRVHHLVMWRLLPWTAAVAPLIACHGGGAKPKDAPIIDSQPADVLVADASPDASPYPAGAPPVGECTNGWCWVYPLPQGYDLAGIVGSSASDVWVFVASGTILHYDGTGWTSSAAPGGCGSVSSTFQTASNNIWVAGSSCGMHWDGSTWSTAPTVGAIGGLAANDIWMAWSHWDGSQWTAKPAPTSSWGTIAFGGSGSTTLTVSATGGIAQWLGTSWGIADAGTHPANAAVVIDATHVVLAQNAGQVSLWNSGTWTTLTTPAATNWDFVTATSPSDIWVASHEYGAHYAHWDGSSWSSADDAENFPPAGIWRDPSGALWAAMWGAKVRVWNGTAWTSKTVGDSYVTNVWGTGWSDIWALTWGYGFTRTLHWDGSNWSAIAFPFPADNGGGGGYTATAIWGAAPDDFWIAGGHGLDTNTIERTLFHWDGSAWSAVGPFGAEDYNVSPGFSWIWGAAANDIYAVGRTAVYHYDGSSWTAVTGPPGGSDVFGSSGSDVYVLNGTRCGDSTARAGA